MCWKVCQNNRGACAQRRGLRDDAKGIHTICICHFLLGRPEEARDYVYGSAESILRVERLPYGCGCRAMVSQPTAARRAVASKVLGIAAQEAQYIQSYTSIPSSALENWLDEWLYALKKKEKYGRILARPVHVPLRRSLDLLKVSNTERKTYDDFLYYQAQFRHSIARVILEA